MASMRIAAMAGTLVLTAAAHAEITGVQVSEIDFSSGYVNADGSIHAASAAAVSAEWTAFSNNWTTYRLWATVDTIDSVVGGFVGSVDDSYALVFDAGIGGQFFNSGGDTPTDLSFLTVGPTIAFDSWLTIGDAEPNADVFIFDPDNAVDGFSGTVSAENLGVLTSNPTAGGGVVSDGQGGFRVLLGQFTVESQSSFSGQGRIIGGGQIVEVEWLIPAPGGLALLGLAAIGGRRRRR